MSSPTLLISELPRRDVAILGAGREGLAAWRALRRQAPEQVLTIYSEDGFAGPGLPFAAHDRLVSGPLDGARLATHEVLIRSPGISPYRQPLRQAASAGAELTTGSNLWLASNPGARTLCVTGTKGKSTSSALLFHLLEAAGARVGLAGNIGRPLLDCDPAEADWWVLELSSYQICDLQAPVWLALMLNLSEEHLDWHGNAARYASDKLRLLELAPAQRRFANGADAGLRSALQGLAGVQWFNLPTADAADEAEAAGGWRVVHGRLCKGGEVLPPLPALPGVHSLHNLAAALTVVDYLDLRPVDLPAALATFRGLPHRLATVGHCAGVRLVDDSLSTTPVATLAALRAFPDVPVTVLLGGLDRGLDWSTHGPAFRACAPHAVIALPDSGPRIAALLKAQGLVPPGGFHEVQHMGEAVSRGLAQTPEGGVLLLSPGAPSFPHYRDYAARGTAFWEAALDAGALAVTAGSAEG